MKKIKTLLLIGVLINLFSCDKMDDNYKQYLENEKIYSPRVLNLTAVEGLRTVTLNWENPEGEIAKKIYIDYQDDELTINEMVNTVTIDNLEIKGYQVSVYTIDEFGNLSIPNTIPIFPNGENDNEEEGK